MCTTVTAALACSSFSASSNASGRPIVRPRPTITTCLPGDRAPRGARAAPGSPRGVHGRGASTPITSRPRFTGCSPSASLSGSIASSAASSSMSGGSGSCTMNPSTAGSSLNVWISAWRCVAECRPGSSRWCDTIPTSAARLALATHVRGAVRVVAHEDRAEARRDPAVDERVDPHLEPLDRQLEERLPVQQLCASSLPHPDASRRSTLAHGINGGSGARR